MIGAAKGNVKFAQSDIERIPKSMKALRLKPICCVKRKQRGAESSDRIVSVSTRRAAK